MNMKIKAETKIVVTGGSLRTTVPKNVVELLDVKEGDSLCWNLDITEKGPTLTITPKKCAKE
jgi:antitoxin component of MazEF toxin-antitoxin module